MDKKEIEKILGMDLFKELNLEDVEPEVKQTILDDAGYVITRGIWIKITESLSDEKQNELSEILKTTPRMEKQLLILSRKKYQTTRISQKKW